MKKTEPHVQFMAVYDTFVNDIFMFFYSKTWKRNLSKDFTQETFMKTWQELSDGKIKGDMRTIHISLQKNAEFIISQNPSLVSLTA